MDICYLSYNIIIIRVGIEVEHAICYTCTEKSITLIRSIRYQQILIVSTLNPRTHLEMIQKWFLLKVGYCAQIK